MTTERRVIVHADRKALAEAVAAQFIAKLAEIVAERGSAQVCLTGGTMGEAVLQSVAASPDRDSVGWGAVTFWWGDERYLPRGDPERNETQSRRALLDSLGLRPEQIKSYPAPGEFPTIEDAADAYAAELAAAAPDGALAPAFDITLLGVGPDGHIASLFPEHETLRETERAVVPELNSPKPPPERLSLTRRVINGSARVWLVLAGADKAGALGLALTGADYENVPAAGVHGRYRTMWWVDEAAAADVPENLIAPDYYWTAEDE